MPNNQEDEQDDHEPAATKSEEVLKSPRVDRESDDEYFQDCSDDERNSTQLHNVTEIELDHSKGPMTMEIIVYENERWWLG